MTPSDPLPLRYLTADFAVAPQLDAAAMAQLALAGFKSVINNRPDFEAGPDQPTSAQVQAAALAAGLVYRYQPVGPAYHSPEEISAFAELLQALPAPVLAYCRSGTRSARLFAASQAL
jgi:uncharacterized protein (TIGR01244 family)